MSILLSRLLGNARDLLQQGDVEQAESLCCQVISGAIAVKNGALAIEAGRLLAAMPDTRSADRDNATRALFNEVVRDQNSPSVEPTLALADVVIALAQNDPWLLKGMLEVAAFIASSPGLDRMKYLKPLLDLQRPPDGAPTRQGIDCSAEEGPAAASGVLATRGCVLVRKLFDTSVLDRIRQAVETHFAANLVQAACLTQMAICREPLTATTLPFLRKVMAPFFRHEPQLMPEVSYVRQVAAHMPESTVPFHQDFNAFGRLIVNVWAPMVACGRTAPGLEFVAERVNDIADTIPAKTQYNDLEISEALIKQRFGEDRICAPEMAPGDVLVLLPTTIHRTYVTPEMAERRTSLELRFG